MEGRKGEQGGAGGGREGITMETELRKIAVEARDKKASVSLFALPFTRGKFPQARH